MHGAAATVRMRFETECLTHATTDIGNIVRDENDRAVAPKCHCESVPWP
jgi:hypothetical protein